jgi:hypothetical protein
VIIITAVFLVLPNMPDQIDAADLRHFQVGNDKVNEGPIEELQGVDGVGSRIGRVPLGRQTPLQDLQRAGCVIDNENRSFLSGNS